MQLFHRLSSLVPPGAKNRVESWPHSWYILPHSHPLCDFAALRVSASTARGLRFEPSVPGYTDADAATLVLHPPPIYRETGYHS